MMHSKPICKRLSKLFLFALCFGALCIFTACAPGDVPAAQAPTTLDLRDAGLTDVSDLLTQTQLVLLDLRGNALFAADFDALRAALPDCDILWSVPLGDARFDSNATTLSLDAATDDLEAMLAYFPDLSTVRLSSAPDSATAAALRARYSAVQFLWDVELFGLTYPESTQALDLSAAQVDLSALKSKLDQLPALKQITFGDEAYPLQDQLALAKAYPSIDFIWNVQLLEDLSVRSDITELDLQKYKVPDAAAFSDALVLFPNLTLLDMCGAGPDDDEMAAMRARYPAIKFVWYTRVSNWIIRTDIKGFSTGNRRKFPDGYGWYASSKFSYTSIRSSDFENLKYCTDLIALDVGHCTSIGDVEFLKHHPQLIYLDIALCDLTDISVLADLRELIYLNIMYNYLTDVTPLKNCPKLRFVNASNNNLTSADTFLELPVLERLWLNCSGLSDKQLAALTEKLTQQLPDITIKASQRNPEYAMSYWRKGNEGYLTVQALYGLRAQHQGTKKD